MKLCAPLTIKVPIRIGPPLDTFTLFYWSTATKKPQTENSQFLLIIIIFSNYTTRSLQFFWRTLLCWMCVRFFNTKQYDRKRNKTENFICESLVLDLLLLVPLLKIIEFLPQASVNAFRTGDLLVSDEELSLINKKLSFKYLTPEGKLTVFITDNRRAHEGDVVTGNLFLVILNLKILLLT